ncbi:MAG TPA: reductase [Mycobacteriales bacterium]|nr:reductase [Mycobacteriales bacterium]
MRLLVLGGTRFLGRAVVDAAVSAGDQVTTFTRGVSGEPPLEVEALHGDRGRPDGLDALRGREWDAVVDTCGFVPRVVSRAAKQLAGSVGHYAFISSVNVYPSWPGSPIRAGSPVHDCQSDAGAEDGSYDLEQYGPYKAGCERAVDEHFAGRSTHVRAGLIVGPYDDTGRFCYWVNRVARGGEVLAPGDPERELRVVDARDLGAWAVECARTGVVGAFVATGPAGQTSFGELLADCRAISASDATVTWVGDEFLVGHEVTPWSELPLWAPAGTAAGLWDQDTSAAEAAGLRCRPVRETAADTLAWLRSATDDRPQRADRPRGGLDAAKEAALLTAWHAR